MLLVLGSCTAKGVRGPGQPSRMLLLVNKQLQFLSSLPLPLRIICRRLYFFRIVRINIFWIIIFTNICCIFFFVIVWSRDCIKLIAKRNEIQTTPVFVYLLTNYLHTSVYTRRGEILSLIYKSIQRPQINLDGWCYDMTSWPRRVADTLTDHRWPSQGLYKFIYINLGPNTLPHPPSFQSHLPLPPNLSPILPPPPCF